MLMVLNASRKTLEICVFSITCNELADAIEAAAHPADGKSLYFVARGDGSHVFSNTLAEHNRAVRAFQLKRRSDYRSSPAPESAQ